MPSVPGLESSVTLYLQARRRNAPIGGVACIYWDYFISDNFKNGSIPVIFIMFVAYREFPLVKICLEFVIFISEI